MCNKANGMKLAISIWYDIYCLVILVIQCIYYYMYLWYRIIWLNVFGYICVCAYVCVYIIQLCVRICIFKRNPVKHAARAVVSSPNSKQWLINHISGLIFNWLSRNYFKACFNMGISTHLPLDKMAPISQKIFSDALLWIEGFVFWL